MRLVWEAIGRVDQNVILLSVHAICQDRIHDGRVPEKRELFWHEHIYTVHTIVFIPGFYSREDVI